MMSKSINISLLLQKNWRTGEGIAQVKQRAASLGLDVTTSGKTSVSAKASPQVFEDLFGFKPDSVTQQPPNERDFGTPGGYTTDQELPIPAKLREYVEVISVVPPVQLYR